MARKIFVTVIILALGMMYSSESFSQSLITEGFVKGEKRFNAGVNYATFVSGNDELGNGNYIGGIASYDFLRFLAIGVEAGFLWTGLEGNEQDVGDFYACPLLFDVIFKAPMEMENFVFTPYGIAGFGALIGDVDEDTDTITGDGKIEVNTPFLMKFGGGIDIVIFDTVVLNIEASYHYAELKFDEKLDTGQNFGLDAETVEMNAGYFGGGVKIRF